MIGLYFLLLPFYFSLMYLLRLYRYNKWLCVAILLFVIMQLLVTYKRGMVISPWYQYGMYSEKIYPKQVYTVNNRLSGPEWIFLLSPQSDDQINVPLDNYRHVSQNDSLYQKEISRLFPAFHLPVPKATCYQSPLSKEKFIAWYRNQVLQPSPDSLSILQTVIWDGKELKQSHRFLPYSNGTILLP
jgi:hypothetical protein